MLCLLLQKDYNKALAKLDFVIDTIAKKYANQLWILRGIVNDILGYKDQSVKDLKRAYKYDKENTSKLLDQGEDIHLGIFP